MSKSKAGRVQQTAAWSVMRADRRFLWAWLTISAVLTIVGNAGHAWLVHTERERLPLWLAMFWAVVPPVLVMLNIHGVSTLGRMLGTHAKDRTLTYLIWAVALGAFAWSAVGLYAFTAAAMGVVDSPEIPRQVALLAPFTIDLTAVGATRALVLTAPIAARIKAGMEHGTANPANPSAAPAPVTQRSKPSTASAHPPAGAMVVLPASSVIAEGAVSGDAPGRESQVNAVVQHENAAVCESPSAPVDTADEPPTVPQEHLDRASLLVARGTVAKPVEEIAAVLAQWESGVSERRISALTGWSTNTIRKLRRDAETTPLLTAV